MLTSILVDVNKSTFGNLFQDRPERAIYVPGAARRAQLQKDPTTASKTETRSTDKKSKDLKFERTESPQDSNDSEGPSVDKSEIAEVQSTSSDKGEEKNRN